jgi:hypothetical protein
VIEIDDAVSETYADLTLSVSSFSGWKPESVESRVLTFRLPEPRFVHGIPMSPPRAAALVQFLGEVQGYSASSGFSDPTTVNTQADFRWLPGNFNTPVWPPSAQPVLLETRQVFPRSWKMVAEQETWDSAARTETWATLKEYTVDATTPYLTPFGAASPKALPTYSYWRRDRYVANAAVGLDGSQGLNLVWSPTKSIAQMTLLMVVVPRAPLDEGYSLITAKPDSGGNQNGIYVTLNADSTVTLKVGFQSTRTLQLSGRARPNEPIVVALSVSFDESHQVAMSIIDDTVRTTSLQNDVKLSFADTSWFLNHELDARMEVMEVDLYTNVASTDALIRLGMLFNRVYGVTMR